MHVVHQAPKYPYQYCLFYIHIVTLYLGKKQAKESYITETSDNANNSMENVDDSVQQKLPTAVDKPLEANENIVEKSVSSNLSSPFKVANKKGDSSASLEKVTSPSDDETTYTFKTSLPQVYSTRHKKHSSHRKFRNQNFQTRTANQHTLRKYKNNLYIELEVNDSVHHRRLVCHGQWNQHMRRSRSQFGNEAQISAVQSPKHHYI